MGLFDFLSGKGSVEKTVKAAQAKHAQSADRFHALEKLRDEAGDEAVGGMFRRFGWNYDKSIEDEQEKEWVEAQLVEMATFPANEGDDETTATVKKQQREIVLRQLERSIASSDSIAWQLRILERVTTHDEAWPILAKAIEDNDNSYVRDPSKKIQLINFIGENVAEARAAQALLQYLEDVDETVRFNTVEALAHGKQEETAREPLIKLLLSKDEESRRIKVRILDVMAGLGWTSHGYKAEIDQAIADLGGGYTIDNKGRVKKK
jgi:hypothetical protein